MWKTVKLGDVCTLRNGRAYKKSELLDEGKYPVLRVGNFFTSEKWYYSDLELDETKYCDNGDLLYAWSASFGARIWEGEKVIYHYHIWRVDIDEQQIDKRFLYHWFEFDKERIKKAHGTGTTMTHVSKGSMEKRDFLLPPLTEQQRIAAKLDAAFAEIDKAMAAAERKRQQADKLKQSILRSELFADDASWKAAKLSDVCTINNGGTPKTGKAEYWGTEIQWLTPKDMGRLKERYVSKTARQITKAGLDNSSAKLVPPQSVILSCRAPIGHVAINTVSMSFNQGCKGLVPSSSATAEYLYYFLLLSKQLLNDLGSGTTFKEISSKKLSSVELKLPPLTDQRRIVAKLDTAFAETATLTETVSKQIANYRALKSALLACELQSEAA